MATALTLLALHLAGVVVYIALAASRIAAGAPAWPFVVGLPVLYALLVLVVTLADFTLAWIWRTPRPPDARLGVGATLRMIAQEFAALLPSAWRMIAYPFTASPPRPAPDALPVVLVHGVLCNAGVWSSVGRACANEGIAPVYRLSYGPPLASIDSFALQLAAVIDTACRDCGAARVVVVGHSMGGLVARAYLAQHGAARIAAVITLGTPYHGSRFAGLMAGLAMQQMRPGSRWLAALPTQVDDAPPFTTLWSRHDSMVAPQASCELAGARSLPLVGIGHNALIHDRGVVARLVDELLRVRAAERRARTDGPRAAQGHAG